MAVVVVVVVMVLVVFLVVLFFLEDGKGAHVQTRLCLKKIGR